MTNRYHNGKIYTIRSHHTDKIYIGSTCIPLCQRLFRHRINKKSYDNNKYHYMSSYEILQYEDNYIELLEEYKCENKQQLLKREGELIRTHQNCVNINIAGRTDKQYREDNKENIAIRDKEYYKNNKEVILERQKQYYEDNKEIIAIRDKQYYEDNKGVILEKAKEYYEDNKEVIIEKVKQHYDKIKDSLSEKRKLDKILCCCGIEIRKSDIRKHEKTNRHINAIKNIQS